MILYIYISIKNYIIIFKYIKLFIIIIFLYKKFNREEKNKVEGAL